MTQPNVVVVVSDDQRWDKVTPQYMPRVSAEMGPSMVQGFCPNSLCCPSRTSILTGNYSHTTGVWGNKGPHGGFDSFQDDGDTIAVDFQQAGYRTGMIGKYLNGYEPHSNEYVPPGWSTWFGMRTGDYYDYDAIFKRNEGATVRRLHYDSRPEGDYATNVIRNRALDFIQPPAGTEPAPFFLFLSWTAPHGPAIPDPDDVGRFAGETDFTYGPGTSMLESAYGIDRATGKILDALPADTIVVYMSDNGYMWGEHGLEGKPQPYEEATRISFAIRGIVLQEQRLAANVDLRPTLTAAAGVPMLGAADGIDLAQATRDALPLEKLGKTGSYCGVRTDGWKYIRWDDGREALFDLSADYAEMNNLATEQPNKLAELKSKAQTLCDPVPPGYAW